MARQLRDSDKTQLELWIGQGPKNFTLLYSATSDGCSAATFHARCDHQGATVTVVYNPQGSVYGGYTSASWAGIIGGPTRDDKAFLFQLIYSGSDTPRKFPIAHTDNSIYSFSSYGPTFGAISGHDMHLFSGTVDNIGRGFQLNGMFNFGANYTMTGVTNWHQIHNGDMHATEIEVYSVAVKSPEATHQECRRVPGPSEDQEHNFEAGSESI